MARCVYLPILEQVRIIEEFMEVVNRMKQKNLFFMKYDAYKNLIYEYYSSLKLTTDERYNILDYMRRFRLCSKPYTVNSEQLVE